MESVSWTGTRLLLGSRARRKNSKALITEGARVREDRTLAHDLSLEEERRVVAGSGVSLTGGIRLPDLGVAFKQTFVLLEWILVVTPH